MANMRIFAAFAAFVASAQALVSRDTSCCFHLTASGGASGPVGQLEDGQNRVGGDSGSLPEGQFCINTDGSITDGSGRGCILTPPTTQFQCDSGGKPTPGFSVDSSGLLGYNGQTSFVACATGQNGEMNIYTSPNSGDVTGCVSVQLMADSCLGTGAGGGAGGGPGTQGPGQSTATVPVVSPSPSVPGGGAGGGAGGGEGPGASPSPSVPGGGAGGGEGPGASPSPSVPGGGAGGGEGPGASPSPSAPGGGAGGGGEGGAQSTGTVPIATPSPSAPGSQGPGGVPPECADCPPTTTVYMTVTVDCTTETPGVPGGESNSPGVPGGTEPGQPPSTETPVGPGGVTPTGPAGGAQPTGPAGGGATPTVPAGGGGGGVQPTGPAGGGAGGQPPSQPQPSGGSCPADLSGNYEFPHLIIPIDSSSPDEAYGTQFNGTVTPTVSTIFNFDIPATDAGKTCSLVFLFPRQEDLETSAFDFSGDGTIQFSAVETYATQSTTYNNAPQISQNLGQFTVSPGNSYTVFSFECPAGQTVGYEMSTAGTTQLEFFEDYNPSPIGLFITVC
ncbi:ubiquitin 3 binding protein But2 C-terminal domain-containing protein [Aspergillus terricola var. indicus]